MGQVVLMLLLIGVKHTTPQNRSEAGVYLTWGLVQPSKKKLRRKNLIQMLELLKLQ